MTVTDWFLIVFGFFLFIFITGSIWEYLKGEYEYRKWVKDNDIKR